MTRTLSLEHRAKLSAWHSAKTLTPKHRAAISASLKGNPKLKTPRGVLRFLSLEEREDYRVLRKKGRFTQQETLAKIGRFDLIGEGRS